MTVSFTHEFLSWHMFRRPERVQVLVCLLLHASDGVVPGYVTPRLPALTGLSDITVSRSLHELDRDGVIMLPAESAGGERDILICTLPVGVVPAEAVSKPASKRKPATAPSAVHATVHDASASASPAPFIKPTIDEVAAYIREKGYSFTAERWYNYQEEHGWMVGKGSRRKPMKDWKGAVRTFNNNERYYGYSSRKPADSYATRRDEARSLVTAAEIIGHAGAGGFSQSEIDSLVASLPGAGQPYEVP